MSNKAETNGNGAGIGEGSLSAAGIREVMKENTREDGVVEIDGLVEASVLCMFFVQKLGQAAPSDILEKVDAIGAALNEHLAIQALEALRGRGLLSYASGRRKSGSVTKMYKTRKTIWAAPPEVAHIVDLLPNLVATKEAKGIIDTLNDREDADDDGTKKKKSRTVYSDYADVRVDFRTLDELLGSQPDSPHLTSIYKASPHNGVEAQLRFWRSADGAVEIGTDAVRGWLRSGLRQAAGGTISDSVAQYIGISPVLLRPKRMSQAAFPVIDRKTREGKGLYTHEVIPPGERFSITFRIPTRNFMRPKEFVRWLASYAPNPIRGISPARGGRFGKLEVVGWAEVGASLDAALESAKAIVSEDGRKLIESLA